ncbi:MAG: hypothetical protein CMM26_13030 [Rhodospirillaceae bacterium]|nr:hypothetical protein [Rhodospirillaceae bacterium]
METVLSGDIANTLDSYHRHLRKILAIIINSRLNLPIGKIAVRRVAVSACGRPCVCLLLFL